MPRHPDRSQTTATLSSKVYSGLAARARTLAGPVHPLHVGDTWMEPHPSARAEAQTTADHPHLHTYASVIGEPVLREAITSRMRRDYGMELAPEELQVVSGGTVGLSVVCQTVLDPGDEVLLPSPYWPLIRGIIASRGAVPVEVPWWTELDSGDPIAALEAAVTERTAAIYLNSPNNPTGRVLDEGLADRLADFAERHGLWVFDDAAYAELYFTPEPWRPLWTRPAFTGRTIASHTFSKTYGLAGARVGWVSGPAEVMEAVRGVQTFQVYCAPKPMQYAAARALGEADEWVREARAAYDRAGKLAAQRLGLPRPEGSTFLFFDTTPHRRDGEDTLGFLERCLDAGVLLTPGAASGSDYESWVRLCFTAVDPEALADALERLAPLLGR